MTLNPKGLLLIIAVFGIWLAYAGGNSRVWWDSLGEIVQWIAAAVHDVGRWVVATISHS
jgi:hypothetical protein